MIPLPLREEIIVLHIDFEICKSSFNDCMQQKSQNHHTYADIHICLYRTKLDNNVQESCTLDFGIICYPVLFKSYKLFSFLNKHKAKNGSIINPGLL
jgi:hypothetical protein